MKISIPFLEYACKGSWGKDTSYQSVGDAKNPKGQCAITSMIVQDYFDGEIRKIKVGEESHYFNLINEAIIDFTAGQFPMPLDYSNHISADRINFKEETIKRYGILKQRTDKFINDMDLLSKRISNCTICQCCGSCSPTFTHFGYDNRILLLGEAPAKNGWRISGRAWYEPSGKITATGKILKKLLSEIDLTLEDLPFTEAIKCTPESPKYLKFCGINCQPFLIEQLKIMKPQIIVPLGVRATELLLPPFKKFSDIAGQVHKTEFGLVIPIYHPSPISPLGYKGNLHIMQIIKQTLTNFP
ncbi:MAG: hypothetical protein FWG80_01695 [Alphaproteobacteria bacterium]|nr:hypothetical protein [Alphaproteobacteria bacterium]